MGDPSSQEFFCGGRNSRVWLSPQLFDVSLEIKSSQIYAGPGAGGIQIPSVPQGRARNKIFLPGALCEMSEWGRNLNLSPPSTPGSSSGVQEGSEIHAGCPFHRKCSFNPQIAAPEVPAVTPEVLRLRELQSSGQGDAGRDQCHPCCSSGTILGQDP